ncbi:MAG: Chromosome partition protein Smc [Chlamydiae bacterium]|nr:Chromosome partition protein Smc [Chlamydiota bacterium]
MHLKHFILQGFKSFSERTTLKFGKGITAIVGPNGCGKSNIADAIRWVTGEKSAKSLRSPAMADVIFSGTQTRKPLNFAEVTITLSDVEGVLPTEYNEVAITRTLYRDGQSNYKINGNTVRLKDIEDLLSGTGVGKNSIAIFEQGKIDEVIYLNPVERRTIIEEVAGISRFITRKKETLRNLKKTEDNIARVRDILTEVEKQKKTAERQAQKAMIYREKKDRLDSLDKSLLVSKWRHLNEQNSVVVGKKDELHGVLETTSNELMAKENELAQARAFQEERELVLRSKSESLYKVRSEREVQEQTILMKKEKLQESLEKMEMLTVEIKENDEKIGSYKKEQNEFATQKNELEALVAEQETNLNDERKQTEELDLYVSGLRDQQVTAQRKRLELIQKENEVEGEWKQAKLQCDHFHERRDQAKLAYAQMIEDLRSMSSTLEHKKKQMAEVSKSVDDQKEILTNVEEEIKTCQDEVQNTQNDLNQLDKTLTEAQAQKKVLMKLKEEMQGFSAGTKRLVQESKRESSPLYQKLQGLYEVLTLDEKLPESLSVALRPYSQTLVVKTDEDFQSVLDFSRQQGLKDFSILCLAHLSKHETQLIALLPHEETNDIVCHFLHNIHIVESPETVFKLGDQASFEYCTHDNAFVDRHRVVFYPGKEENNTFVREVELKSLNRKISKLEKDKIQLEAQLQNLSEKRQSLQQEKGEVDKALRKEEMNLVEVNFALQRGITDLKKAENDKEELDQEIKTHEKTIHDLTQKLNELAQQHESTKKLASESIEMNTNTESALEEQLNRLAQQKQVLQEKEAAFQKLLDKKQELSYHLNVIVMRIQEADLQTEKIQKEIENCQNVKDQIESEDGNQDDDLQKTEESIAKIEQSLEEEKERVTQHKSRIEELDSETTDKRSHEKKLIEQKNSFEIRQSQLTSTCEALQHELDERYQLSMDNEELSEIEQIPNLQEAEREVKAIRREIDKLGPVNMEAIEEKEEHADRYEFLLQQVQDLEESKEELCAIITELEHESRKLYEETFEAVRVNFRKNFEILFSGGEADLKLVGSEDVLEAGIEITAKPPGKYMRSITLLSGGEKCLTALALLFALFEVKPSPFCILDEIDAPLDDSNIQRFVEVLKQFAGRCQFIIITHNKRTMAIADTLYGVTMEEKGISKLLSLEFEKDKAYAEPELVEA